MKTNASKNKIKGFVVEPKHTASYLKVFAPGEPPASDGYRGKPLKHMDPEGSVLYSA